MIKYTQKIGPDKIESIIKENTPICYEVLKNPIYTDKYTKDYFKYYLQASSYKELVTVNDDAIEQINFSFNQSFKTIVDCVLYLFKYKTKQELLKMYSSASMTDAQLSLLIDLASCDINEGFSSKDSFYARFDSSTDTQTGVVNGIYEINSDTPTMLFESIILQNEISVANGDDYLQVNEFYNEIQKDPYCKNKNIAVVCSHDSIEDLSTSETVAQLLSFSGNNTFVCDIQQLNHDVLNLDYPFFINGLNEKIDLVYMLLPWEEMVSSGYDILSLLMSYDSVNDKKVYRTKVRFIQPAIMWFVGNKKTLAYLTQLNEEGLYTEHCFIPTYLDDSIFKDKKIDYVSKPAIGRFSQNIRVHQFNEHFKIDEPKIPLTQSKTIYNDYKIDLDGRISSCYTEQIINTSNQAFVRVSETSGVYDKEDKVYQKYTPAIKEADRSYIFSPWMYKDKIVIYAFRGFNGIVNNESQEAFIGHEIV